MGLPRIGLTAGDPAGIGPEVAEQAARDPRVTSVCEPQLYRSDPDDGAAAFAPGMLTAGGGRAAFEAVRRAAARSRRIACGACAASTQSTLTTTLR